MPAGILAFSGFIPTVDGWQPELASRVNMPVLITHGRADPIMDVGFARHARERLDAAGLPVTYLESDVAHQIDPAHIPAATLWLAAATRRAAASPAATTSIRGTVTTVRKLQSQGVHHITLVGADRQTSIDFWEGVLGMPFVFEQPNLDNAAESHLYFDPGDGRLITVFTNEERTPDPRAHADRPGLRPPRRVRALPGDVRADGRAARRARDQAQRRQGPRVHGLDLLHRPARAADRARRPTGSSRRRATPTPTCCSRRTGSASSAATTTSRRCTSPTRSSSSSPARGSRCPRTARRRIPYAAGTSEPEWRRRTSEATQGVDRAASRH